MDSLTHILGYWQRGGPLMPAIAVASVGIWFYFLTGRTRLLAADASACALEARLAGHAPESTRTAPRVEAPAEVCGRLQQDVTTRLGRDLVVLAALTAVAPLLGLLGTVMGMIATFEAVARIGGDPSLDMSGGISQALITTQFGLVVAIPGVFGLARLQRLLDAVRVRVQCCQSRLLVARAGAT